MRESEPKNSLSEARSMTSEEALNFALQDENQFDWKITMIDVLEKTIEAFANSIYIDNVYEIKEVNRRMADLKKNPDRIGGLKNILREMGHRLVDRQDMITAATLHKFCKKHNIKIFEEQKQVVEESTKE